MDNEKCTCGGKTIRYSATVPEIPSKKQKEYTSRVRQCLSCGKLTSLNPDGTEKGREGMEQNEKCNHPKWSTIQNASYQERTFNSGGKTRWIGYILKCDRCGDMKAVQISF